MLNEIIKCLNSILQTKNDERKKKEKEEKREKGKD